MEFSGLEAQVFIGVAVILGCAFVALLCDYLKGVNERLRERTLELTVRVEESDRWSHILQTQALAQPVAAAAAPPAEASSPDPLLMNEITRLHREMEQMARSVASLAELKTATTSFEPVRQVVRDSVPAPVEELAPEIPEIAAMAAVHAEEPAAARVATPQKPTALPPLQSYVSIAERPVNVQRPAAESVPAARAHFEFGPALKLPARVAEPEATPLPFVERVSIPSGPEVEVYHEPAPVGDRDVAEPVRPGAMKIRVMRSETPTLPAEPAPQHFSQPEPVVPAAVAPPAPPPVTEPLPVPGVAAAPEPLPEFVAAGDLALPSGMHDRATLDFLRNDPAPFTGLVVAIGINEYERLQTTAGVEAAQDLVRSVSQLVKSLTSNLVGPQHFASRSAEDEFIIAFNGEIGPAAQRRMSSVSERLWDFQLRSIGTLSVVFSWGATEANEESFAEAIDAACERMRETRQNRQSMGGEKARKRVVA